MIAHVQGTVVSIDPAESVVVAVGGIGLRVLCPAHDLLALRVGDECQLHTHLSVSQDAMRLYGFLDRREVEVFELLLSVERIGPKAALAILGPTGWNALAAAIAAEDVAAVASYPSIGRKTAERLVLELKGRMAPYALGAAPAPTPLAEGAVVALTSLGYGEKEARSAVERALASAESAPTLNQLVSEALRLIPQEAGSR